MEWIMAVEAPADKSVLVIRSIETKLAMHWLSAEEHKNGINWAIADTKKKGCPGNKRRRDQLTLTPLVAGNEVGRSCVYMSFKGKTVLVLHPSLLPYFDCGIHPAYSGMAALPYFDEIDPSTIDGPGRGESDEYRPEACLHHTWAKKRAALLTLVSYRPSFPPQLLHWLTLRSLLSFSANL
ncbi:hypothetical protein SADUNF_Sadunf01G0041100 [Salix dunnii]|uniref:Uncharacterized protein n=1 Tax=Salix dunnii TaxID=1413687 RepID=A0A835TJY7_9ROSI|nr:hypothetical protein SADUNF_Sadunf01G0041100 [Salix dunnii]